MIRSRQRSGAFAIELSRSATAFSKFLRRSIASGSPAEGTTSDELRAVILPRHATALFATSTMDTVAAIEPGLKFAMCGGFALPPFTTRDCSVVAGAVKESTRTISR